MSYTTRPSQSKVSFKGSVDSEGVVLCECNKPAILLETRKPGPNQGRYFYKCDGEPKCKTFLWQDEQEKATGKGGFPATAGNRLGGGSQSQSQSQSQTQQHPPSTPKSNPPSTPKRGGANPTPLTLTRKRSESVDDEVWERSLAKGDSGDEDDIELIEDEPTPSKKAKFTSFSSPVATPKASSQFSQIMNDPNSPFHARHASLFSSPLPSSPSASSSEESMAQLEALIGVAQGMSPILVAVKKEMEKKDRLIRASKKKEDFVKNQGGAVGQLTKENEKLKERIRALEIENEELRSRKQ